MVSSVPATALFWFEPQSLLPLRLSPQERHKRLAEHCSCSKVRIAQRFGFRLEAANSLAAKGRHMENRRTLVSPLKQKKAILAGLYLQRESIARQLSLLTENQSLCGDSQPALPRSDGGSAVPLEFRHSNIGRAGSRPLLSRPRSQSDSQSGLVSRLLSYMRFSPLFKHVSRG